MKRLSLGALAISMAIVAPALAQPAPAPAAPATPPAPAVTAPAVPAPVTAGMTVKDNTGATIGSVASVQPGPDGAPVATIKMGLKTFTVATNALAVSGGSATINASQAQIDGMLPKS